MKHQKSTSQHKDEQNQEEQTDEQHQQVTSQATSPAIPQATPRQQYVLKYRPEDFIVEEILTLPPLQPQEDKASPYSYFLLEKKAISFYDVLHMLAKRWQCSHNAIRYAGIKDKNAYTKQIIAVANLASQYQKDLHEQAFSLKYLGQAKERPYLGMHSKNSFTITVRNLSKQEAMQAKQALPNFFVPNYFGNQRFSKNNIAIGTALLRKEWKLAYQLLAMQTSPYQQQLRAMHQNAGPLAAIMTLPGAMLKLYLGAVQAYAWNKAVGMLAKEYYAVLGQPSKAKKHQLQAMPKPATVQGEQQKSWQTPSPATATPQYALAEDKPANEKTLMYEKSYPALPLQETTAAIKNDKERALLTFPLLGFDAEEYLANNKANMHLQFQELQAWEGVTQIHKHHPFLANLLAKATEQSIAALSELDLCPKDFIIRQIPILTLQTSFRPLWVMPEWESAQQEPDELFANRQKLILKFSLPKGSYATIVIEGLLCSNQQIQSGK